MTAGADAVLVAADGVQRHGAVAAAVGTAVLVISVIGLALSERGIELAAVLPAWLALAGLAALVAMVAASWLVHAERPGVAAGLAVMAIGLAVPFWTVWDWVPAGFLPILLSAGPIAVAGAAHVGLGWLRPMRRSDVLIASYAVAGLGVALVAVGYDPVADPGCAFTCADADPAARSLLTTRGAITASFVLLMVAAGIGGWAVARERRAPPVLRLGVGACLAALLAGWALHAVPWADPIPGTARIAAHVAAAMLAAAAVLSSWWVVRGKRFAAERLVAELNDAASTGGLIHGVRAVEFAIPGERRWVDPDGRPVPERSPEGGGLVLRDGGEPAVRVWMTPGASSPALDSIGPSARVALANARLTAVTRARLDDVRASRRRIVVASDAERRRIERDLHDGAQQRLITASLHVSVAANRLPGGSVARTQAAIGEALDQLRRVAHGLGPDNVRAVGLRAALEDLARGSEIPTTLVTAEIAVDDAVAVAIHAAVTAALARARDVGVERARLELASLSGSRLALRIEFHGPSGLDAWDPVAIADGIGAVDGTMTVDAGPTRFLLQAELPCAS